MSKLYHKQLGLPQEAVEALSGQSYRFHFSRHALDACLNDRYGKIVPPAQVTVAAEEIIEVEIVQALTGTVINKVVIRKPYNAKFALLIAFIPDRRSAFVKTCWLNSVTDSHETLDESKYTKLN